MIAVVVIPAFDLRAVLRAVEPGVVVITDFSAGSTGNTQASGQGTGMVLDTQGDVLTNAHVVAGATTLSVQVFGQPSIYRQASASPRCLANSRQTG